MFRIKTTGDVIELFESDSGRPLDSPICRLSSDEYLDKRTGEILPVSRNANRTDDMWSLRRSLAQGRDVINANISRKNIKNVTFLTLTYRDNMQNLKKLYRDFDNFNRNYLKVKGKHEYILAVEPQERGAWHIHVLVIWQKMPFLPADEVGRAWGKGFIDIDKIDHVDNVGAYLTAYLTDIFGEHGREKYARLALYPRGMHPIRWSRGCVKPTVEYVDFEEFEQKKTELSGQETYSASSSFSFEKSGKIRKINYQYHYYNTARVVCQEVVASDTNVGGEGQATKAPRMHCPINRRKTP